jgi:DNA-binding GntR family transcriptional regulator
MMSGKAMTRARTPGAIQPLLSRTTIKDSVRQTLRELILDGVLSPGSRLVEADLAQQFGTSSTPVREALLTLAAEHLVTLSPHQGGHVSRLSYAALEERLFIRDALEAAAIARVVEHIGDSQIARARAHLDAMRQAMEAGDPGRYRSAQRSSREAWLEAARYPQLARMILDLQDQDARVSLFLIMKRADRWAKDFETNRLRLDAIASRDARRANALTRQWHDHLLREIRRAIEQDEGGVRALLTDSADFVVREAPGDGR